MHTRSKIGATISCLSFFLLPFLPAAQQIDGEYFLEVGGSEVIFRVRKTGPNQLEGVLIDSDGTRFQVRGILEQGDARGTLANDQGGMYFEAYPQGEQLALSVMPVDVYNQPDYLNAKKFALTRRQVKQAPIEFGREGPAEGAVTLTVPEPEPGLPAGAWEGAYEGAINETVANMYIRRYGNQLSGEVDAGGYKYILEGSISGNQAWGEVLDPQTGGKMEFSGTLSANLLFFGFQAAEGQLQVLFMTPETKYLLGKWLYAQAQPARPGAPGRSRALMLSLQAGGRYYYGDAQAVQTAPEGKDVARGQWRILNSVLYIEQGGQWKPFAPYEARGNSLLFIDGNGKVQEWKKVK